MKKRILVTLAALAFSTAAWAADNAASPAAPPPAVQAASIPKFFMYIPKPTDVIIGNDSAPVTIVEYASLSCPHCAHFFNETLPVLSDKYITSGKAKLVYRDYPLDGPALQGSILVQCADKEQRHAFIKVLFKQQTKWAYGNDVKDSLINIGVLGGVNRTQLDRCMANGDLERAIVAVRKEAEDEYKVNSTPTFFINGEEYKGDNDIGTLSKAIDAALAKVAKK